MNDTAKRQTHKQNPTSLELVSPGITLAMAEKKMISKPQSSIYFQMGYTLKTIK